MRLDEVMLSSGRLMFLGRPDRVLIPEEWEPSAGRLYPGHRLQLRFTAIHPFSLGKKASP